MPTTNTPFPLPIVNEIEKYVWEQPATGRKYQAKTMAPDPSKPQETVIVWSTVSDVKNRTWVSAEDPFEDVGSFGSASEPVAGDLWWDTHQLELRVLHHPIVGKKAEGDQAEVLGAKQWISSTHPMANSITKDGRDKNHMFGPLYITGDRDAQLMTGEEVEVNLEMPFYTGDDILYTPTMRDDIGEDPVAYADKRYTIEWTIVPEYNADVSGMPPDEAEKYKNTYEIDDPNYPNTIKVTVGEIAGKDDVLVKFACKVTAKEEFNDKFLFMGMNEAGDAPALHYSKGESAPFGVFKRAEREVLVPFRPATAPLAEVFVKDARDPGGLDPALMTEYTVIPDELIVDDNEEPPNTGKFTVLEKTSEIGAGFITPDDPEDIKQVPHTVLKWYKNTFSHIRLYFSYGVKDAVYSLDDIPDEAKDGINYDTTPYDGMTSQELAENFKLSFYKDGYEQNPNGAPELDDIYQIPYTFETSDDVEEKDFNGDTHICRKVTLYYDSNVTPDWGVYYTVKDSKGEIIPGIHGQITGRDLRNVQEAEDE